ncbi:MAG: hypothetical protein J6C82_08385 [Clostridia bacterium]|nr:hypothetical protein [Clostridia bacterium]
MSNNNNSVIRTLLVIGAAGVSIGILYQLYKEKKYNKYGYNKLGYDRNGYDKNGFNKYGQDKDGYFQDGFNIDGFNRYGFDRSGYDEDGFDKNSYDEHGFDKKGLNQKGVDRIGYDKDGRQEILSEQKEKLKKLFDKYKLCKYDNLLPLCRIQLEFMLTYIAKRENIYYFSYHDIPTLDSLIEDAQYYLTNDLYIKLNEARTYCNVGSHYREEHLDKNNIYFTLKTTEELLSFWEDKYILTDEIEENSI